MTCRSVSGRPGSEGDPLSTGAQLAPIDTISFGQFQLQLGGRADNRHVPDQLDGAPHEPR